MCTKASSFYHYTRSRAPCAVLLKYENRKTLVNFHSAAYPLDDWTRSRNVLIAPSTVALSLFVARNGLHGDIWILDLEDFQGNSLFENIQEDQVKSAPAEMGLFI